MSSWNFMHPASRKTLLDLIRREADGMFALVDTDVKWAAGTGAGHWTAGNVVGHLVDTTETYFIGFDAARGEGEPSPVTPLRDMAPAVDACAQALKDVPRAALVERCRADLDRMLGIFEELTDAEWTDLIVPHKYMGPIPAFFYPIFQLVDYAVHSWDIREGTGVPHALAGDSADMLVPLCFALWTFTPEVPAGTEPYQVGVRICGGENAGDRIVSVGPDGVTVEEGAIDDLPSIIEFDAAGFVLTAYGRTNAGTVRGDVAPATALLGSFYRI